MGIDLAYPAPDCGEPETRPGILLNVHYTYFGALMIVITSAAIVVISLLTTPRTEDQVRMTNNYLTILNPVLIQKRKTSL
jgi:hypothetical protein